MAAKPGKVFIIAEAGVNHNGSIAVAKRLVKAAALAGADAVKFQAFRADRLATRQVPKAEYQKKTTGNSQSQWQMLKLLELGEAAHIRLKKYTEALGIEFLSSPFDLKSADMLIKKIGVKKIKVPSGEITNAPLLLKLASSGLPMIVSTGMSTMKEIEEALGVLAFGYTRRKPDKLSCASFRKAFKSSRGKNAIRKKITLLQCTTQYPAPSELAHLRVMRVFGKRFGVSVGYSDHTKGIAASLVAVALGASVIEKHLTLDQTMEGPDHKASLKPDRFREMVEKIRRQEDLLSEVGKNEMRRLLGRPKKSVSPIEKKNRQVARKSIISSKLIRAGELFSEKNLDTKRSGQGISPMRYWDVLGKTAVKNFTPGEMIYL